MSDGPAAARYIEVPVQSKSTLNVANLLLIGGLGYVVVKTFLLEERVNDLTVSVNRQRKSNRSRQMSNTSQDNHVAVDDSEDYETSDDDSSYAGEEDEVRIQEQPYEMPPESTKIPPLPSPPKSAFVSTRQRSTGSELRRGKRSNGESDP